MGCLFSSSNSHTNKVKTKTLGKKTYSSLGSAADPEFKIFVFGPTSHVNAPQITSCARGQLTKIEIINSNSVDHADIFQIHNVGQHHPFGTRVCVFCKNRLLPHQIHVIASGGYFKIPAPTALARRYPVAIDAAYPDIYPQNPNRPIDEVWLIDEDFSFKEHLNDIAKQQTRFHHKTIAAIEINI